MGKMYTKTYNNIIFYWFGYFFHYVDNLYFNEKLKNLFTF